MSSATLSRADQQLSGPGNVADFGSNPGQGHGGADERDLPQSVFLRQLKYLALRTHFLVDKRTQLRSALMVTGVVLVLLVLLNVTFQALRATETASMLAVSPDAAHTIAGLDRTELVLGLLASAVMLVGVFLVAIFETHRTAGAALAIARRLRRVAGGDLGTELTLRKGDNLRELETAFNEMTRALRDHAAEQATALRDLAEQIEGASDLDQGRDVAKRLREVAERTSTTG
jgi:methyl-accepting chemotaxis protein